MGEGEKLEETILTIVTPCLRLWHHVYQDSYCNSMSVAETLLNRMVRVCSMIKTNRVFLVH